MPGAMTEVLSSIKCLHIRRHQASNAGCSKEHGYLWLGTQVLHRMSGAAMQRGSLS